jgi:CHRD domain-containing protein
MKRSIASIMLMCLAAVSVASLMTRHARADVVVFTAQLLSSNEVPPVSNADAGAFGSATVTIDTTANTARFDFSCNGVASPQIILAHVHEGAAGVNGPVRIDSGLSPASPLNVVSGGASATRTGLAIPAGIAAAIVANPAGFYFNMHSTLNPGGVVRGQLVRATVSAGAAPTLSEWGAILMTLLIIATCTMFLVGRGKAATEMAATEVPMFTATFNRIDLKLFAKVALYVEAAVVLALIALRAGAVDIGGALTSGLLVAFIAHLFIGGARRR